MIAFLSGIFDMISGFFSFIGSIISSIIWLIEVGSQSLAAITTSYWYAPDFLVPFMMISMALTAVFALIRLI